jgi:tetratricopeptide (TPR) repeat protein
MYDFALQLDPEHLPTEPEEWNGQKQKPAYHRWLYIVVRSLLELKRYDECLEFASRGIEKYPNDKLFYWWQARAKLALGQVEDALSDFERIDIRFPKEWYVEQDIANCYMQLQKYEEALLWFCKAANHPGHIEGRYKMFEQMSVLLERLERWQESYDHLQLAQDLAKKKHWDRPAQTLQGQLMQFRNRHAEYFSEETETPVGSQSTTYGRCKTL